MLLKPSCTLLFFTLFLCSVYVVVHTKPNITSVMETLKLYIRSKQQIEMRTLHMTTRVLRFYNVAIDFIPTALIGLDEERQVLSFSGTVTAAWTDYDTSWDPSMYSNISAVSIRTDLIWVPKVSATNSVNILSSTLGEYAFVYNTGVINTAYADKYQTSCRIDTSFFPFDEQTCDVLFFPAGTYSFFAHRSVVSIPEFFFESNEWKLLSVNMKNKTFGQTMFDKESFINTVEIRFKLKRYSSFHVMSILVPIVIMSLMNAFVFLLPVESGEKMSYLVSIFVSYAMFLNFIYGSMPKSDSTSRLAVYLLLVITQSCLSILVTLYLLNVHHDYTSCGCSNPPIRPPKTPVVEDEDSLGKKCTEALVQAMPPTRKRSIRTVDRMLFVLFCCLAVFSLLVFIDF